MERLWFLASVGMLKLENFQELKKLLIHPDIQTDLSQQLQI